MPFLEHLLAVGVYAAMSSTTYFSDDEGLACLCLVSSYAFITHLLDKRSFGFLIQILFIEIGIVSLDVFGLIPDMAVENLSFFFLIKTTTLILVPIYSHYLSRFYYQKYTSIFDSIGILLRYCALTIAAIFPALQMAWFSRLPETLSPISESYLWANFLNAFASSFAFFFIYAFCYEFSLKRRSGRLDFSKLISSVSIAVVSSYLFLSPEFSELRPLVVFPVAIWLCLILGPGYMVCYTVSFFASSHIFKKTIFFIPRSPFESRVEPEGFVILISLFLIASSCTVFLREKKMLRAKLKREIANNYDYHKNAAMNKMAGSIAHEINNPLSIILGYAQMLKKLHSEGRLSDTFLSSTCSKLIFHSDRIHGIVNRMKKLDGDVKFDQGSVLFDVMDFLNKTKFYYKDENLSISTKNIISNDIKYPAEELSFALKQLVDNAVYFSSKSSKPFIELDFRQENENYIFEIKDNGDGISGELSQAIYEPFFTTKKNKHGIGLGLSLTYNLIKAFKGNITHYRSSSNLTVFKVELPVL